MMGLMEGSLRPRDHSGGKASTSRVSPKMFEKVLRLSKSFKEMEINYDTLESTLDRLTKDMTRKY